MAQNFSFANLQSTDLIVDAIYEGGTKGDASDDPLARLIPGIGNQGGFRFAGPRAAPRLVVLYSTMDDPDWPDTIDLYTGVFAYFGDNKKPGAELHETARGGNAILRTCFSIAHNEPAQRSSIPPFLIFTRVGTRRDVVFRGLAVPGLEGGSADDLVAIWRSKNGQRFQNYLANFTILDIARVPRKWLEALQRGEVRRDAEPPPWRKWLDHGIYEPLTAAPTVQHRNREEQLPSSDRDRGLVDAIYEYFRDNPYGFEHCAARLAHMLDSNIFIDVITRPSTDGGRDAIGTYRIGPNSDRIPLSFALEAKCYSEGNGVGVKELARLISRLRHREFGILVTTSYLGRQAYEELRADAHPVIVIAGADIAHILVSAGIGDVNAVKAWLAAEFPKG